ISLLSAVSLPHRPSTATLFPYTTLFRSKCRSTANTPNSMSVLSSRRVDLLATRTVSMLRCQSLRTLLAAAVCGELSALVLVTSRSEEHTSELQSHLNLVCRLLLEKKNTK